MNEFLAYFDKPNTGNTPENKGQCVGLVSVYMDSLGIPHEWGNADDLLTNADPNFFDVIFNRVGDSSQFPVSGDVLVWDKTWGNGFGHTGLVIVADGSLVATLEQNNPTGHAPQIITHTYNGVLGWLHPKEAVKPTTVPPTDTQETVDQLRTARDTNWNLYQAQIQKTADLATLLNDVQSKPPTIVTETVTKEVPVVETVVKEVTKEVEPVFTSGVSQFLYGLAKNIQAYADRSTANQKNPPANPEIPSTG